MASIDTVIRGGRVTTASDVFSCEIGIREVRIVALDDELGSADEIIDATGKWLLPGGIDSHLHLAAFGRTDRDGRRV
jgi:dihydropyrimidinase